jgi:hypothetical protein
VYTDSGGVVADKDGILLLDVFNAYQERVDDTADITLDNVRLTDRRVVRRINTKRRLRITDLFGPPEGVYRLEVDALGYMPVQQFVNLTSSDGTAEEITCPVDPKKVVEVSFPIFTDLSDKSRTLLETSNAVLGFENKSGADLYGVLDDIRKAGLLNILAKCSHTKLASGALVIDSLQQLQECRGDRFFCKVTKQLREDTKNSVASGQFFQAPELLHHPPDGFTSAESFKTPDHYGNLQLSFFTNGTDWLADIDIDDAGGLEHAFQVIRNFVENRPTHAYDIHEILVFYQKLDPGYRLVV